MNKKSSTERREAGFDLAWLGVIGPLLFIASWIAAGLLREGHEFAHDSISSLAEHGAPNRWLVLTGTIVVSVGAVVAGVLLHRRWRATIAAVVTVIAGISALSLFVFPCSPGCPGIGSSFTDTMHSSSAAVHYVAFGLAPLVVAIEGRGLPRLYGSFAVLAALIGGSFLYSHFAGWGSNGVTQKSGLTTLDVWLIVTSFLLTKARR